MRGVFQTAVAGIALALALPAAADRERYEYPTLDKYQFITECMVQQGEVNHQTLYACACTIDVIAEHLSHDDFAMAETAQRAANMTGESGEVFREPPRHVREVRRELAEAKSAANDRCFVPPNELKNIWPDF